MRLISVIIPIYNTELYIQKAIESVLIQPEKVEIIIVDDGSTDKSLSICELLASEHSSIKVLQHHDKKNHGRSASRNLGIETATGEYIAFLDADDFYLDNRFANDLELLKDQSVDGVYNAISAHFYRDFTETEKNKLQLTTIREEVAPERLFECMGPIGHYGYFSGIGLTVRKSIFEKVGLFNEDLQVAEDTELWLKMSLQSNLAAGIISKPVAMRGVHHTNISFKDKTLYSNNYLRMFESLLVWGFQKNIPVSRIDLIWKKVWFYRTVNDKKLVEDLFFWTKNVYSQPILLKLKRTYTTFPPLKRLKRMFD
jgi:glycosyltransferase involved in cell wall biosynthesis